MWLEAEADTRQPWELRLWLALARIYWHSGWHEVHGRGS